MCLEAKYLQIGLRSYPSSTQSQATDHVVLGWLKMTSIFTRNRSVFFRSKELNCSKQRFAFTKCQKRSKNTQQQQIFHTKKKKSP